MVMSTTFEIGRIPAASSRAASHSGEGPICTSSKTRAVKRGQRSGHSTAIAIPGGWVSSEPGSSRHGGARERSAGRGVQLARDAVDGEAVGAVGRDLELEHVGPERQHLRERRAGRGAVVEHEDAGVIAAERDLVGGEDHPVAVDPAQLGGAERAPVGHLRARARDRDGLARRRRWGRRRRS